VTMAAAHLNMYVFEFFKTVTIDNTITWKKN